MLVLQTIKHKITNYLQIIAILPQFHKLEFLFLFIIKLEHSKFVTLIFLIGPKSLFKQICLLHSHLLGLCLVHEVLPGILKKRAEQLDSVFLIHHLKGGLDVIGNDFNLADGVHGSVTLLVFVQELVSIGALTIIKIILL